MLTTKIGKREDSQASAVENELNAQGSRAWLLYFLGGILAIGGYYLLPSPSMQDIFTILVDASVVAAIATGIFMYRPSRSLLWYLFFFGMVLQLIGDVIWTVYRRFLQLEPYPSLADILYLAGFAFFVAGLLLIGRRRIGRNGANLIDPLILAVSVGMILWVLLQEPTTVDSSTTLPLLERLLPIIYLLVYIIMITLLVRPLFVPAKRSLALYLLCGGGVVFVVTDLAFGAPISSTYGGTYEVYAAGSSFYGGMLFSTALLGAAALHPSMVLLSESASTLETQLTWRRFALITAATLTAPAVVAIQAVLGQFIDVPLIVGGSAVLFLLVTARMAGMIAENKRIEDALRESEARYREMVELTPEVIAIHTAAPDPKWVYTNAAGVRFFGASKPEELIGTSVEDFIYPHYLKFIKKRWRRTQVERKPTEPAEIKMFRLDGEVMDVESRGIPATHEGRPATQVFFLNITERKRAEEEMKEANRRLEELAVLKADFTRMVAHEFGGPLGAMRKLTEMLSVAGSDPEIRSYATAAIEGEIVAMNTLVADVRSAGEAERDDFKVMPRPVGLLALLRGAEAYGETLPGEHPIELVFGGDLDEDEQVRADPERVAQVLRNLLSNAAKYSPEGTPIELRAVRSREHVRVEVADCGPGIPADDLTRIFEKFGRGRDQEGRRIAGVGLGLYLSRRIIRSHGSELAVSSTLGEGSIFRFELEVAR